MYYAYIVKAADGDVYKGLVAGDSFVSAMCKVDDYYDSACATSVLLTCVTAGECYDIDDVNEGLCDDDDEDEEEDDYDEMHGDSCDGNVTFEFVDSHVDTDELEKLMLLFKRFEEEE
jgi:hypothetical protein